MESASNQTKNSTPNDASVRRRPSREPNRVELQLLELVEQSKRCVAIDSELLMSLYRELEPVSLDFMIGTWHGSLFNGQSGDGWWGKNMISPQLVQPLLFQREDGSVYSNEEIGRASCRERV